MPYAIHLCFVTSGNAYRLSLSAGKNYDLCYFRSRKYIVVMFELNVYDLFYLKQNQLGYFNISRLFDVKRRAV